LLISIYWSEKLKAQSFLQNPLGYTNHDLLPQAVKTPLKIKAG
jgi:hypothetical protein